MAATETSVSTANLVESSGSPCWGRGCSRSPYGIGDAVSGEVRPAGLVPSRQPYSNSLLGARLPEELPESAWGLLI